MNDCYMKNEMNGNELKKMKDCYAKNKMWVKGKKEINGC